MVSLWNHFRSTAGKVLGNGNDSFSSPFPLFIKIEKQAQNDSFTAFGVLEIPHDL